MIRYIAAFLSSLSEPTSESADVKEFWVNMPNLMNHLKKVAEQKPQATYYNVDMIKYQVSSCFRLTRQQYARLFISVWPRCDSVPQVSAEGIQSTPLNLALSWRGDATNTDLRIDYKYNTDAMAVPVPLHDIQFQVPVDGVEAKVQAMVPPATW